jgi:very-short-patch-repair endonuclease
MKYKVADPLYYSLLHEFAKENKQHATEAEQLLWHFIRGSQLGVKFNRQHIIGKYIADFVCLDKKLIIEVDGAYHSQEKQQLWDEYRDDFLKSNSYKILRFTNNEVLFNMDSVLDKIRKCLILEMNEG